MDTRPWETCLFFYSSELLALLVAIFCFQNLWEIMFFFLAIAIGCMSTAVLNLNNMRDRIQDAKVQKNTLAVVLGAKNVKTYHSILIISALVSALVYLFASQAKPLYYLALIAFIPLLINMFKVFKNEDPALLDPELKKIALSTFVFALLLFVTSFF